MKGVSKMKGDQINLNDCKYKSYNQISICICTAHVLMEFHPTVTLLVRNLYKIETNSNLVARCVVKYSLNLSYIHISFQVYIIIGLCYFIPYFFARNLFWAYGFRRIMFIIGNVILKITLFEPLREIISKNYSKI